MKGDVLGGKAGWSRPAGCLGGQPLGHRAQLASTYRLQPWHANLTSRLTKAPKVYVEDSGLACHLAGITALRLESDRTLLGQMLECFVIGELRKQVEWSTVRPAMYHFRTHEEQEVDCILEDSAGRCVAIEIKAASHVSATDARGLRFLQDNMGDRFHRGIVLYSGDAVVPFDKNIHAMPIDTIWTC